MTDVESLKDEPTPHEWEVELRRLIDGERAYALVQVGSIEEYVREIIISSRERAVAETAFQEALRNVVQAWQPSLVEKTPRIARMLDLIASFTPLPGFLKVMDFLEFWEYSRESPVSESVHARPKDLRMKALLSLSSYFPASPPLYMKDEPAFLAYVHLLREHLLRPEPEYSGYAARRLMELQILEPDDAEVRELIELKPKVLRQIVSLLLKRHTAQKDISNIYGLCLLARDEALEELMAALRECRASIQRPSTWSANWPELRMHDGRRFQLELTGHDDETTYLIETTYLMKQRWGRDAESGEEVFNTVQAPEGLGLDSLLSQVPMVSERTM